MEEYDFFSYAKVIIPTAAVSILGTKVLMDMRDKFNFPETIGEKKSLEAGSLLANDNEKEKGKKSKKNRFKNETMTTQAEFVAQSKEQPQNQQSEQPKPPAPKKIDLDELLEEDMFIMGRIDVDEDDGLLSYNDFDRLFRIIQKHATFRVANDLEMDLENRVQFLHKNGLHAAQNQEYRQMAMQAIKREETVYNELSQKVCEYIELDYDIFQNSMRLLLPSYQQEYVVTKKKIDFLRDNKWTVQISDARERKEKMVERQYTKDEVLKIFSKIQKTTSEMYQRLGKVRDEMLSDEYSIESILQADRIVLEFEISSQRFYELLQKYDIDEEIQHDCSEELNQRIVNAQNHMYQDPQNQTIQ